MTSSIVGGFRRRADRIAALGLVAVGRGQPHVDMLAGAKAAPVRRPQEEALHRGVCGAIAGDRRLLPGEAPPGITA